MQEVLVTATTAVETLTSSETGTLVEGIDGSASTNSAPGSVYFNALPTYIKSRLDEKTLEFFKEKFAEVETARGIVQALVGFMNDYHSVMRKRLLAKLDNSPYDRQWHCSECGRRWGRHNRHTLACPGESEISDRDVE